MFTLRQAFLISGKVIFFSALDWGMGHATRSVPVVEKLVASNKIIIGITPLNREFFKQRFPGAVFESVPTYGVKYSSFLPVWLKVALQWPRIKSIVKAENRLLKDIIAKHGVDVVISDSRYGLYNSLVFSIFITHQLRLRLAGFSFFANRQNKKHISRFDEIWVPDYEDKNARLSGELSSTTSISHNVKFIGPQSQFSLPGEKSIDAEHADILVILSGVEPQRSILEKLLFYSFYNSKLKIMFVRGSDKKIENSSGNIKCIDFPPPELLRSLIVNAGTVICRGGYSTLMDLHLLDKKDLILIPTPGQTEQEYLAEYWKKKFGARVIRQSQLKNHKIQVLLRTRSRLVR
jgi:uncharacterized protein (TIGR00661 family)